MVQSITSTRAATFDQFFDLLKLDGPESGQSPKRVLKRADPLFPRIFSKLSGPDHSDLTALYQKTHQRAEHLTHGKVYRLLQEAVSLRGPRRSVHPGKAEKSPFGVLPIALLSARVVLMILCRRL